MLQWVSRDLTAILICVMRRMHVYWPLSNIQRDASAAARRRPATEVQATLSSCLIQIPITHAFHAVANRDGHIGRGDLADALINTNAGDLTK